MVETRGRSRRDPSELVEEKQLGNGARESCFRDEQSGKNLGTLATFCVQHTSLPQLIKHEIIPSGRGCHITRHTQLYQCPLSPLPGPVVRVSICPFRSNRNREGHILQHHGATTPRHTSPAFRSHLNSMDPVSNQIKLRSHRSPSGQAVVAIDLRKRHLAQ